MRAVTSVRGGDMIEGFHLDFPGEELRHHLIKKKKHHQERAAFYLKKAEELSGDPELEEQVSGGNPVQRLREKAAEHSERAHWFTLAADHILQLDTYRLGWDDLRRLELVSGKRHY